MNQSDPGKLDEMIKICWSRNKWHVVNFTDEQKTITEMKEEEEE